MLILMILTLIILTIWAGQINRSLTSTKPVVAFFSLVLTHMNISADVASALDNYQSGNVEHAYIEFKELAELGNKAAQFNLGLMYYKGDYVARNLNMGYGWIKLGTENDSATELEQNLLEEVLREVSDTTVAETIYLELANDYSTAALEQNLYPVNKEDAGLNSSSAVPRHIIEPLFPMRARREGIQGNVELNFMVDRNGKARDVAVIESFPGEMFSQASLDAIVEWIFIPPVDEDGDVIEGKLVRYLMEYRLFENEHGSVMIGRSELDLNLKAADEGNPIAQFNLGYWVFRGYISTDISANEWLLRAATQGLPQAQYQLGYNLVYGIGCETDSTKGLKWLTKAAEKGERQSKQLIARLYARTSDGNLHTIAKDYFADVDDLSPRDLLAYTWMLIKSPNPKISDPKEALDLIDDFDRKKFKDDITKLELEAAAHARLGNYRKAKRYQRQALNLAEEMSADTATIVKNLAYYKVEKLWF